MSSSNSSLREVLNGGNPNEVFDATVRMNLGDALSYILANLPAATGIGYTETGISVTSSAVALANAPVALFQVKATAGTTQGVKKLRKGPVSGPSALVPATGEVIWDGGKNILFAAVDAVSAASFLYAVATDIASVTEAELVNS